jgi:hypothetical protein
MKLSIEADWTMGGRTRASFHENGTYRYTGGPVARIMVRFAFAALFFTGKIFSPTLGAHFQSGRGA